MRIAIFSEVYWPMVSGVGLTLRRLAEALTRRGHAVQVHSATYHVPPGATPPPELHPSPSLPLFLYPDVQWAFPRLGPIVGDLERFRPDLVHVATEFAMGLAGVRAASALGVPVIASAHTDYEQYARRYGMQWALDPGWSYLRWFYAQARTVLCPTGMYARHLAARGVANTAIWSRGVDRLRFHPRFRSADWRARFGSGPIVLWVSRLAREKNLHLLLEAWDRLGAGRGDARLVLVGGGPLEAEVRRRRLPGVHLLGVLEDEALTQAYASADLFVFPSGTETFGNVLLEAMASGLPCLAVRAGGVMEFARHGESAWLVEPDSVEALVSGLERLLLDASLRAALAEGALGVASGRDWARIHDGLLAEYGKATTAAAA